MNLHKNRAVGSVFSTCIEPASYQAAILSKRTACSSRVFSTSNQLSSSGDIVKRTFIAATASMIWQLQIRIFFIFSSGA